VSSRVGQLAVKREVVHAARVPLTQPDRLFIESRRARRSYGLYVLPIILLVLLAVWGALFVWWPLAVNPKAVWGAQESGELNCGSGTLSTYATGATVLANVVFALLGAILVLRIAFSSSERRYLKLIGKLEGELVLPATAASSVPTSPTNVRQ
jgi:hypothetical protein